MKKKKLERILAAHYRRIEALEEWRLAETSAFNNRDALAKRIANLETGEAQLHALIEGLEKRLDAQRSELLEWLRRGGATE